MTILSNLKSRLIFDINSIKKAIRTAQYKSKTNTIIRESETTYTSYKYINPAAYKQRLKSR
ncbi:MAG: hypothetical protein U9N59_11550 [Campylobacterota bacterium]|nr:hypothetical protein [Campylobacterota bacterium]